MKTTVDLPDALLIEAKKRAAEERTSLRAILTRGLRLALEQDRTPPGTVPGKIRFLTVDGGLPPGLDVSDRAAMHHWLRETS